MSEIISKKVGICENIRVNKRGELVKINKKKPCRVEIERPEQCKWEFKHDKDFTWYESTCGRQRGYEPPEEWKFCPYCGKEIKFEET